MSDDQTNFDDPGLKQAVRQLRGGHHADAEMRHRVESILKQQAAPKPGTAWWIRPMLAIAAAIVVVIAGVAIYHSMQPRPAPFVRKPFGPAGPTYDINPNLLNEMVAAQKNTLSDKGTALAAPTTQPDAMTAEVSGKLQISIPKLNLTGWQIDSARLAKFGNTPGLLLHLSQDNQKVTLISVPSAAYKAYPELKYQDVVEGCPIAGTVIKDTITCVVADASVDLKRVAQIRDQILGQ